MKKYTLKELREKRGLEPSYVAEYCSISLSYLYMLESGERNPSDKLKLKFAELYNVSETTIFLAAQLTKCKINKNNNLQAVNWTES